MILWREKINQLLLTLSDLFEISNLKMFYRNKKNLIIG